MPKFAGVVATAMYGVALTVAATPAIAGTYQRVYVFKSFKTGDDPGPSLIDVDGLLFGTTHFGGSTPKCASTISRRCGTVFAVNPSSGQGSVVYAFPADRSQGADAGSGLTELNGILYGAAKYGGPLGSGTIYSINPSSGAESLLYSVTDEAPSQPMVAVNGVLYGVTPGGTNGTGSIFSFDPATNSYTTVYNFKANNDGALPNALLNIGGILYGTTAGGNGSQGKNLSNGTIYSFNPSTGVETVLYAFNGGKDGITPAAGLTEVGGVLYGTTLYGGTPGLGTVFSFNLSTSGETVLHAFKGNKDGATPGSTLIDVSGTLYGVTVYGGSGQACSSGCGTLFSVNETTGDEKVLHDFKGGKDGSIPAASLINVGGTLYGTTQGGGKASKTCNFLGCGTVFSYTP